MFQKTAPLSRRSLRRATLAISLCSLLVIGRFDRVEAAAFVPGNVVIYRVGDGTAALSGTAAPVFLDEYSPTGTLVSSLALPTLADGANFALTATGNSTSEGLLNLSVDRTVLTLTGYNAAIGTALPVSGITRVVAVVSADRSIDTTTAVGNYGTNASNIRSAISTNGTDLWTSASQTGIVRTTRGSTGNGTVVSSTVTNTRGLEIFDGQLYVGTGASNVRVGAVGTGTPASSGQTTTSLPGLPVSAIAVTQFTLVDLEASVPGVDTLYFVDDLAINGLWKYSLVGGTWVSNGSIGSPGASAFRGFTALAGDGIVSGFAVGVVNAATTLFSFSDTGGYNAPISGGGLTSIATAPANTAFRGLDFTPGTVVVPEAGTGFYLLAGVGLFSLRRPRTARRAGARR